MKDVNMMSDEDIVRGILKRDVDITKKYLFEKCYPLFKAIHNKYYTDCENVAELINEIYVYILTPNRVSGRSKLADFGFRCTLTMWIKIVSENFCRQLYTKKIELVEDNSSFSDRYPFVDSSLDIDLKGINMEDVHKVLNIMPNQRYRRLIELRYLEEKTNEETAELLVISMDNYYNKHKLAKAQFCTALRKEGLI